MKLIKFHDPNRGVLNVAGLMSGSGTNLRKVIEHEAHLKTTTGVSPYHVAVIFTDNIASAAPGIGKEFDLPVVIRDISGFYAARGVKRFDLSQRHLFDTETVKALGSFDVTCAVYAGYMSIASNVLTGAFLGINVHPGDLTVLRDGARRWTGVHAVADAIRAGETSLRSTTHLFEPEVDGGKIFMLSRPVPVVVPPGADLSDRETLRTIAATHQEVLKTTGDWEILPRTLEYIAAGRFSHDEHGSIFFDGQPAPRGISA